MFILAFAALLAGGPASAASDLAKVRASGKLTILTDLSDPNDLSKLFFRGASGYDGIEYVILQSFAKTLGAKEEVSIVPFAEVFDALGKGRGDVVGADITATPERASRFDLSDSYFPFVQMVVTRTSEKARSFEDLAGKNAITQKGTTWETACRRVPRARLLYTDHQRDLFGRVADGSADFAVVDSPIALTYIEHYPNLKLAWSLPGKEDLAFALRKGSDLTPLLNAHIRKLKSSGAYYALLGRFYGQKGLSIIRASESAPAPPAKR